MVIILTSFVLTVYRNLSGRTEKTKSDYVLADERSISLWTMLVSLAKGFLGIRVFLGKSPKVHNKNMIRIFFNRRRVDFYRPKIDRNLFY